MSVLWGLLQKLDAELRGEGIEFNSEAKGVQGRDAEVRMVVSPAVCESCVMQRGVLMADDLAPARHTSS